MTRRYGRVTAPYTTCANEYLLPELAITEGLVTRSEAYINLRAWFAFQVKGNSCPYFLSFWLVRLLSCTATTSSSWPISQAITRLRPRGNLRGADLRQ